MTSENKIKNYYGTKITVDSLPQQILDRLSELAVEFRITDSVESFKTNIFDPMILDKGLNATDMEQSMYDGEFGSVTKEFLIKLSCAYCIESINADKSKGNDSAWLYASFAQYWLGVANGMRMVVGAGAAAYSVSGMNGFEKSDADRKLVRKFARDLIEKGDYQHLFRNSAAKEIMPQVVAYARSIGMNETEILTEESAQKRINVYIDGLPFRETKSKKQQPKK